MASTRSPTFFRARGAQRFKNVGELVEVFVVEPPGEAAPRELSIDPVCQMAVDPGHAAARRERGGQIFMFCSEACAAKFDATPGEALAKRTRNDVLASDRARDLAARLLRSAYGRGRIDVDELEQRSAHVEAARTRAELRKVLGDLPEYRRWRAGMRRRRVWIWLLPRRLRRRFQ